jgi:hypothetical protein
MSKGRCLLYHMAAKMYAVPCGYAVPSLGFYYIPNSASIKSKEDVKGALFRVSEGTLTIASKS